MKHAVHWLRDAVAKKTTDSFTSGYYFTGEEIRASNGELTAGFPFPSPVKAMISRSALDGAVKAAPDGALLEPAKTEGRVTVKSKGYRVSLDSLSMEGDEDLMAPPSNNGWTSLDPAFPAVLADLAPFVGEDAARLWMQALIFHGGHAYATNGKILARSIHPIGVTQDFLIPKWVVDFVAPRTKGLRWWSLTQNYIAFRWENGAWLRGSLIEGKTDPRIAQLIAPAVEPEGLFYCSDEWKGQMQRAFAVLNDLVEITDSKVTGLGEHSEVEIDLPSVPGLVLPKSAWHVAELKKLLPVMTEWNPTMWPKVSPWRGDRVLGIVTGVFV